MSPIMRAAARAAEIVAKWSPSKQAWARRVVAESKEAAPPSCHGNE
jgi:hypothetical protein